MSRLLAMDIGHGTTDVMLFDDRKNVENSIKMVFPTPTKRYEKWLRERATGNRLPIYCHGDPIGGARFAQYLIDEAKAGRRIVMTSRAAFTVENNLEAVGRKYGIEVDDAFTWPAAAPVREHVKPRGASSRPPNDEGGLASLAARKPVVRGDLHPIDVATEGISVHLEEIEIPFLMRTFEHCGEDLTTIDGLAIAVQDHGTAAPGQRDRVNRFAEFTRLLEASRSPFAFAYAHGTVPERFVRLRAAWERGRAYFPRIPIVVMDTAPSAMLGCLAYCEEMGENAFKEPMLLVNAGNNHTFAVTIEGGEITSFYEHHTWRLRDHPRKVGAQIRAFADGTLTAEEVIADEGEGTLYFHPPGFKKLKSILLTGPNRSIFKGSGIKAVYAAPGGDMMMTGPIGLRGAWNFHHLG